MAVASRAQATRAAILRNQQLAAEHRERTLNARFEAILKTAPRFARQATRDAWHAYTATAVVHLGKRQLPHVVWPWEARPQRTHTPRGKVR